MNLDVMSDQELVDLSKSIFQKISERVEVKKKSVMDWASQFKNKDDLLYNYLNKTPKSLVDIIKEISIHFNGKEKDVLSALKNLVDSEKVVEENGNYRWK